MTCEITRGPVKIVAVLEGELWTIRGSGVIDVGGTEGSADVAAASFFTRGPEPLDVWHRRFNHANVASLRRMAAEKNVYSLELTNASADFRTCVGCAYGKHSRDPFPSMATKKTVKKLELVHSDLCGPLEVMTVQTQKKYILTFIDDFTRRSWIYLLASKDETFSAFKIFKAQVENSRNASSRHCIPMEAESISEESSRITFDRRVLNTDSPSRTLHNKMAWRRDLIAL